MTAVSDVVAESLDMCADGASVVQFAASSLPWHFARAPVQWWRDGRYLDHVHAWLRAEHALEQMRAPANQPPWPNSDYIRQAGLHRYDTVA